MPRGRSASPVALWRSSRRAAAAQSPSSSGRSWPNERRRIDRTRVATTTIRTGFSSRLLRGVARADSVEPEEPSKLAALLIGGQWAQDALELQLDFSSDEPVEDVVGVSDRC
uniref:Uncharacterized protein n=1 Tax=Plectus sambesii TaxID=2011161 RepID=A0A914V0S9_9BILA